MCFLLGVDTKLKFTLEPSLGQNGFQQVTLFLVLIILFFWGIYRVYTEIYSQNGKTLTSIRRQIIFKNIDTWVYTSHENFCTFC